MKTILIIALFVSASLTDIRIEAAATGGAETNKTELNVKSRLLKLFRPQSAPTEIVVPEMKDYQLQQVAVIEEPKTTAKDSSIEYLAVYKKNGSNTLTAVLYDANSTEQLVLDSVKTIDFESKADNSRILLERTGPNGQVTPEALLVPGHIEVAQ